MYMEAILITSIILLITIIVIGIRVYRARRKEDIRRWCVVQFYKTGNYTRTEIEKMAEFLIRLPNKELKYYKEILPLTDSYTPDLIVKGVEFITQGITFSEPYE